MLCYDKTNHFKLIYLWVVQIVLSLRTHQQVSHCLLFFCNSIARFTSILYNILINWANEIMVYHHCYPHQKWYTKYNTYTSHKSFLHHLGHLTWYFKLLAPSLTSSHLCHTSVESKKDSLVEPKVHASSTLIW